MALLSRVICLSLVVWLLAYPCRAQVHPVDSMRSACATSPWVVPADFRVPDSLQKTLPNPDVTNAHQILPPKMVMREQWIRLVQWRIGPAERRWGITLSPLGGAEFGYDLRRSSPTHTLAYGGMLQAHWRNRFFFEGAWEQQQVQLPTYQDSISKRWGILQGRGIATANGKGWSGQSFQYLLTWAPNRFFSFSAGRGSTFIGEGQRSLLLSDNAAPMRFFRIMTRVWKVNYQSMFCLLQDIRGAGGDPALFGTKYASIHHLSWQVNKRLTVGIFEAIVFQNRNQNGGRGIGFDVNYLNPVLFFRPVEYSVGSPDNSLLGAYVGYSVGKHTRIYGQVMLDEFLLAEIRSGRGWVENKQAFQLGVKQNNLFGRKEFSLQIEYNWVRPYTYYHKNGNQNYGHYNQSLAHPIGANFSELLMRMWYKPNKSGITVIGTLQQVNVGLDTPGKSWGQNIFQPYFIRPNEYGNFVGQGLNTNLWLADVRGYLLLSSESRLSLFGGLTARLETSATFTKRDFWMVFGLRTLLWQGERFF